LKLIVFGISLTRRSSAHSSGSAPFLSEGLISSTPFVLFAARQPRTGLIFLTIDRF
jgi:hypothetical protein